MRKLSRCFLVGLALVFGLSMAGCGGGSGGPDEATGGGTTSRQVAQSYDEQCRICHGSGTAQDIANLTQVGMPHYIGTGSPRATVTAVREVNVGPGDDRLAVDFTIVDSTSGFVVTGVPAANIRFTLARLDVSSGVTNWQSYINTGTAPSIVATSQRANAAGGIFTDNSIALGTYSYRFSFNMNAVTTPVAVSYLKTATHRIAMQVSDVANNLNVDNAFVDFVPNSLPWSPASPAPAVNRKISTNGSATTSCNSCHVRLGFHGGGRINVEYCVTCHNPGSTDPTTRNTVDFKVMIHKIHNGSNYTLGTTNFSDVVYPQDIRNCTKCHTYSATTTPQGDNWKNVPSDAGCTSCHDDPGTYPTFPNLTPAEITTAHLIPEAEAAKRFKYNIITPITNTAPGQFPVIRFSVQNPQDPTYNAADPRTATYNILTAKEFNSGAASTLNILISWPTKDYTNTGSLRTPAQPISINPRVGAKNNGDGTFTVASSVPIPATVTGSGTVAIEGHPAVPSDPVNHPTTYDLRVPVTGVVQSFAITDAAPQNRRTVVDTAKCEQCHGLLSLHGANRNRNTQLCVICHNANATDINRRPASGVGTDGKAEEAIDFKYMIHSIHAGKAGTGYDGFRTNGLVVYGFTGATDFSDVLMPTGAGAAALNANLNIRNCLGCHNAGTFGLPVNANALPTTTKTGSDKSSPDDDVNITPTASVCSSCHDDIDSVTHMASNGAKFDYKAYITVVEGGGGGSTDQATTCGPGPVSSQPTGHTSSTDCCSCHSPH